MTDLDHNRSVAADKLAVAAVLEQLVACWNRGDGTAFGACFTEDADYIDVTGTHTQGQAAIARTHQYLFEGPLKGSQLESGGAQPTIVFLAADVVLVIGGGTSRLAGQLEAPEDRRSVSSTVLVRRDGTWLIRAFQNNRVQPRPAGRPSSSTA